MITLRQTKRNPHNRVSESVAVNYSNSASAIALNTLQASEMFRDVSLDDLNRIVDFCVLKSLRRGSYLFHEGDDSHGLFIIRNGAINLHRVNLNGKEQVIHIFRAGESLGVATLASSTVCPAHARAEEESTVLMVKKSEFISVLQNRPDLVLRVLSSMCAHCRVVSHQIDDLTLQDVETRFCNWLIKHCPDPESELPIQIHLTIPKRVLAAELGTVSETFSRLLSKLRKGNLITVNGRVIGLKSPAKLVDHLNRHLEEQRT